jgi:sugar lactone lactonase YvrE
MGRKAEKGAGAIYRFHGGELVRLYAGVTIPNAICFSPDGATAYFTDSSEGILHRVAIDPANAMPIGNPAILYDHRGGVGGLDGAVVDAEGLICALGWIMYRCLHAGRQPRPHHSGAGNAAKLPGLHRQKFRSVAGHDCQ